MMHIEHLLIHTISYAERTGVNNQGEYTYPSPTTCKARVQEKRQEVVRPDGSRYESSHEIMTATAMTVTTRIWLPGAATNNAKIARTPKEVRSADALDGSLKLYRILL